MKTKMRYSLSPRSGRKHKAWGGAQRNPRVQEYIEIEPVKRATAGSERISKKQFFIVITSEASAAHFVGSIPKFLFVRSWGSASLHPRLYAGTRFAGWISVSNIDLKNV